MASFSQKDLFKDSQSDENQKTRSKSKSRMSSTYDAANKKYTYMYEFVVLFNWNPDLLCPFSHHKISLFTDEEIRPEWISKNLGINSRVSKLRNLSPFPRQVFSLFAKIELGTWSLFNY